VLSQVFGTADLGAESSAARRFALFAGVRGRLARAASDNGLLLVLDDLQWADQALRARRPALANAGSPLSPRELEVARLVARGLTNKQIGEALFVAERTAENHVQHILVKLGFSNRSQIAAWSTVSRE
jgi:DNA-binding NarL/FixJ family response regulator